MTPLAKVLAWLVVLAGSAHAEMAACLCPGWGSCPLRLLLSALGDLVALMDLSVALFECAVMQADALEEGDLGTKVAVPVRASGTPSGGLMVEAAGDGQLPGAAGTTTRITGGGGACGHLSAARALICAGGSAPTGACGDIMEAFRGACGQERLAETNEKKPRGNPTLLH